MAHATLPRSGSMSSVSSSTTIRSQGLRNSNATVLHGFPAPPHNAQEIRSALTRWRDQPRALRFTIICLCISLFGSRFGFSIGSTQVSIVGPAVMALAFYSLIRGDLCFHKARLASYLLLVTLTIASLAVNVVQPDRFGSDLSWTSLLQFWFLTSLVTLRFTQPVDETLFFKSINLILVIIAILGIVQFFAQFVGLGLFSFRDFLPDKWSFEVGFNLQNPIGTTNYFKANGFFLLEPSVFSQFMAIGLAAEILILQRVRYVLLLLSGLIVSLSGTGWLILGSFIFAVAVGMKSRGIVLAFTTLAVLGVALGILDFVSPEFFDSFVGRVGEFSSPGSSAHGRFISPFWLAGDVIWRAPWALWTGIGPGRSERLISTTYVAGLNTPAKVLLDFGILAMFAYLSALTVGKRTRAQFVLLGPGLVMLLLTGSYAQVPPLLFPVLLMTCIPTLTYSLPQSK